jgi:hypothetical protein
VKAIDNTLVHKLLTQAGRGERRPWLVEDDLKAVRKAVSEGKTKIEILRGRKYAIHYFTWRKEKWFCLKPVSGFVPMTSGPISWIMTVEAV